MYLPLVVIAVAGLLLATVLSMILGFMHKDSPGFSIVFLLLGVFNLVMVLILMGEIMKVIQ